ncbi:MAG: TRAP transporter large permease [Oscillospiraceae bacterium]|jgi:TRAP-type C4-dicarboxylate transport system permease large subunit|nr:TRAP transporter large permease [Oscillospiraceae bacterium]
MSIGLTLVIFFGILLVAVFLGSTIFSSMGFTAAVGMLAWLGMNRLSQFGVIAYTQGTSFNQIIAPMFIMMSEFLSQGQIAEDIFAVLNRGIGRFKGGLAISTTLACTIFAALCGSSPATAASIGRISIYEMTKRGYSPAFAVGTVAAGGTLGIMIPPSITFCLYGIITETSIVQLFMAGILPGILLALLIIGSIVIRVRVTPALINALPENGVTPKSAGDLNAAAAREIIQAAVQTAKDESAAKGKPESAPSETPQRKKEVGFLTILPAIILIFIVLGSMYLGFATPLEAAGYGVIGAFIITVAQRRLTRKMFSSVFLNTARTGSMMIFLMMCGFVMTFVLSYLGIPQTIANAIIASGLSKYTVLILVYVLWFILGCLMDPASMIILTIPVMFQTLTKFGFDQLWLGVVVVLAAQIAMITPPIGMNLFVLKANSDVPMSQIMRGCVPYVIVLFIGMAILTFFPVIATLLPSLMF